MATPQLQKPVEEMDSRDLEIYMFYLFYLLPENRRKALVIELAKGL